MKNYRNKEAVRIQGLDFKAGSVFKIVQTSSDSHYLETMRGGHPCHVKITVALFNEVMVEDEPTVAPNTLNQAALNFELGLNELVVKCMNSDEGLTPVEAVGVLELMKLRITKNL